MSRNVTAEEFDPAERFALYRLCDCPTCEGRGQVYAGSEDGGLYLKNRSRCPDCRGEGRIRQEVAACASPEAVGVALVTLAREGEFSECPIGLLDRTPECEECEGSGEGATPPNVPGVWPCPLCKGSGIKPTGTWLIKMWLPSPRNVSDAARVLARSKAAR